MQVYTGTDPYIFISYAHKDSHLILPILEDLQKKRFRIWYDEGIEAGTEWPEYIAEHLMGSTQVVVFLSKNALASQNCTREIHYAISKRKDPLVIFLEDVELTPGMEMQLGCMQAMFYQRHPSRTSFVEALSAAKVLQVCRKPEAPKPVAPKVTVPQSAAPQVVPQAAPKAPAVAPAVPAAAPKAPVAAPKTPVAAPKAPVATPKAPEEAPKAPATDSVLEEEARLLAAANRGRAEDQFALAKFYEHALRIKGHNEKAYACYDKAAQQGHTDAMLILAKALYYGVYVKLDETRAQALELKAAQLGNIQAQLLVASRYHLGFRNYKKDPQEAFHWYQQAAEQGSAEGQYHLSLLYSNRDADEEDEAQAVLWMRRAADQGHPGAQVSIGKDCEWDGKPEEAFSWYKKAADQQDSSGMTELGRCYEQGLSVPVDQKKAFALYQEAAQKKSYSAMAALGRCYEEGIGTAADPNMAFEYYKKTYNAFPYDDDNTLRLGRCYEQGIGTPQKPKLAAMYYADAAQYRNPEACLALSRCYEQGIGVLKNKREALRWREKAAEYQDEEE